MVDVGILIISCDRYADVWRPFFSLFWKYWPDCPYPVYLGANYKTWDDPRVQMILVGDDLSWAESTRKMVENVSHQYIMIILEDWLLTNPVNTRKINELLLNLVVLNGGYLRLDPSPRPDKKVSGFPDIGEIDRGAPYRVSLHIAFWRRDVLHGLLRDGETAWDLELLGSRRSDRLAVGFFSTWKDAIDYDKGGVNRGKWTPSAIRTAQKEEIDLDFSVRPRLSTIEAISRSLEGLVSSTTGLIPWRKRRPFGNLLRQLKLLPPRMGDDPRV